MNIGFAVRSDFLTRMGGDSVQLLNTKKYLEDDFGVQCTIITSVDDVRNESLDVLHIFNMQPQTVDDGLKYAEFGKIIFAQDSNLLAFWYASREKKPFLVGKCRKIDLSKIEVGVTTFLEPSISPLLENAPIMKDSSSLQ